MNNQAQKITGTDFDRPSLMAGCFSSRISGRILQERSRLISNVQAILKSKDTPVSEILASLRDDGAHPAA
jgi:hypothetical protein